MKRRDLLLGLALMAGFSAQAVTSPYTGSVAGEGTFYLYQVETGLWLETNRSDFNTWTTHASLNDVGFDVELKKPEGFEGYQIFCRFTNNGSLNGADEDRFYLDQAGRDVTDWIFEPVSVDGVPNAYKIMAKATPEGTGNRSAIANDVYIGAKDGVLSDNPADYTWQLVSRKERLEKMVEDSANGPVDASWLILWFDQGRNDMRDREWTHIRNNNQGGAESLGGSNGYPVWEYWHYVTMRRSITLTDLPTGTYNFTVQAYYRDGEIDEECEARYINNEFIPRAKYFAGAATADVMSIFAGGKDAASEGFDLLMEKSGKWVPNSTGNAALAMFNGNYINEYIQAPVSDGTLTIGVEKPEGTHRDWLIIKRMYLQYNGQELIGEDISGLQKQLSDLIAEGEALPQTPQLTAALAAAREKLSTATGSSVLLQAIADLQEYVDGVKTAKDDINNYNLTKAITDRMGVNSAEADEKFASAKSRGDFSDALKALRYARRRAVADKQDDVFEGQPVAAGKYYIYNVGQKQFLCGGSDWGAHAALGMPGIIITLEEENAETGDYHIETGLFNGADNHYLSYRGYMDGGRAGAWRFIPVEGKTNVYTIHQADYPDVHVAWNPYASTDRGVQDETTVGTECRNLDKEDLNAQWKLVSEAERKALLEKASIDNPVDATFLVKSPNFNQREDARSVWSLTNSDVWGYNDCHYDFVAESWNTASCDINNIVEGLPEGIYMVSVQGYYRNGPHVDQPNNEPAQRARLYAGDEEYDVTLPNILSESGKAPGEGDNATAEDGTVYNIPNSCTQATDFFKSGLYKAYTVTDVYTDYAENGLPMGVLKEESTPEDWVVVDNFRLKYFGKDTTVEAVKGALAAIEDIIPDNDNAMQRPADDRIFNILGQPVANPTIPGVYIQNGKKFIVR